MRQNAVFIKEERRKKSAERIPGENQELRYRRNQGACKKKKTKKSPKSSQ